MKALPSDALSQAGSTALAWAVSMNHTDVVKALMEHGADLEDRDRVRQIDSATRFLTVMFRAALTTGFGKAGDSRLHGPAKRATAFVGTTCWASCATLLKSKVVSP